MAFRPKFSKSAPQQVEADREILRAKARNLSADEVIAISIALKRGETPDLTSYLSAARADATISGDGLKMTTTKDHADRPIYEFELPAGATKASTWMKPYLAQPFLQIRINKRAGAPGSIDNALYEARWAEDQRLIATGTYQLPEL